MFVYKKFKASDAGILAFEAHKEYNVDSANTASLDISFVSTKYSSASLDTYSGISDLDNSKRYRQIEALLYKGGPQNYGNLLGGFNYIDQEKRLYGRANILEISQKNTGNGIQKGTFTLNGAYKDDSKGNIYDSTSVVLLNGYAQNYPKETEKCFYLGPVRGYKHTDLNHEIRTGRLIVNAPLAYYDKIADDSIYLNSVEYVSCSIEYMDGDLSDYTGVNLDTGYVKVAHSNNFNFSDEDFTISFWYKAPNTTGTKYLVSKGFTRTVAETPTFPKLKESGSTPGLTSRQEVDAGNSYPFAIYAEGSTLYFERSDENAISKVSATLSTNLTHYTFVKEGSTLKAYTNAVAGNTATDNTNNCGNQADLFIGNKGGSRSISSYNIESAGGNISQILILNKAATTDEIENIKDSINGSPFVGNIFYENGLATITKPNIAANTLISAETVTETITLGTIYNDVDPDYVTGTIQEVVWNGNLTFFTSSKIFDLDTPGKPEVDAFPGLVLVDPTFTEAGGASSFILSTEGAEDTEIVEVKPIASAFQFLLKDSSTEVSNSFDGVQYGEEGYTAVGETLDIEGSLLTDIGYPSSEGEYAFYHPPTVIQSASLVFVGAGRSTSRAWRSSNDNADDTNLSSWFNDTLIAEGWGAGTYSSFLRRVPFATENQTLGGVDDFNGPEDQAGGLKLVATNNTSQSGVPTSDTTFITNATTFRNVRKNNGDHFFSITGSRGNIASIKDARLQLSRSQDTEESFVTASNTTYDTSLYFPGGFENGELNPSFTSSEYTHLNSHPNIYSGISSIDNQGISFRPAQLLGGLSSSAVYGGLDEFTIGVTTSVSPSGSAGGQDFQFKLVYYHADDSSYWDIYDSSETLCESSIFTMPESPAGGTYGGGSTTFTINPSNTNLTDIDDVNTVPVGWNAFEDEADKILLLFRTELNASEGGTLDGILINNTTRIDIQSQTPDFGPRDVLYLESDYIYPLTSGSHRFTINGITTDSASLIDNAYAGGGDPTNSYQGRGFVTNLSSSYYISKSEGLDGLSNPVINYDFATVPLALRVELVEFDIDPNSPSPIVPDFFEGGRILTSSLFPVEENIGGSLSTDYYTISDNGAAVIVRDADFDFEITKSIDGECAVAWRMGIVNADNPGDLTDVSDFPLIPVNTAEGFGFSGIHIATYKTTATYSLAADPKNPNPLTNNELRTIFNNTASIKHSFIDEITKFEDPSINNYSLLVDGDALPTSFTDIDLGSSLNPSLTDVYFDTEFLITESFWTITCSYQPALPIQISSSFTTTKKGLYEIRGLNSLYFHNPQDDLNNYIPIYDNWVNNPENAPQLQYKVFVDGDEQTDFTQTSSFAPNKLQEIYNNSNKGYIGGLDAGQVLKIEVTLVTGSEGDDALVYPHQGIALNKLDIIGITSSFQVRKADGSAFTAQQATAVSASIYSPHPDGGDATVPFTVGDPTAPIHIVSFSGGANDRDIMHLGLDYFTTESHNVELEYDNPHQPIEAKFPFSYEPNRVYSFTFGGGSTTLTPLGDALDSDAGLGVKIVNAGGGVIEGSPQKYLTAGSVFSSADDFDATFEESGTGYLIFYSSGSSDGDYSNGIISASYTIELSNIDVEISELRGSDTSNETVAYSGDVVPNILQVTSSHVDAGSHGFFTVGSDTYDITGFTGGKVKIGTTLFITASSPASATIDQEIGYDYTQTPEVTAGTLSDDMIGGTFEFTDATGTTTVYTIIAVGVNSITLSSQTVPALGFDNQILVAPSNTPISITFNQPVDNEGGGSADAFSLNFKNTQLIFENEFQCTVDENEYNYTLNPTARKYKSIDKGELADFATGSNFRPYVTTIGLYNEDNELLVVGKLAQPVRMSEETDTTFVVRYDT